MPEQQFAEYAYEIESNIKIGLLKKHMTQKELAKELNTGTQQLNRAIKGDMSPKSRELRKEIERVLELSK